MKGRHAVKVFSIPNDQEVNLPEGWKPFSADIGPIKTRVAARKWERTEG